MAISAIRSESQGGRHPPATTGLRLLPVLLMAAAILLLLPIQSRAQDDPAHPPRLISYRPPQYPAAALGQSGTVTVRVMVDVKGNPKRVVVLRSSPPGVFEKAAVAAAKTWRWEPSAVDGRQVDVPVEMQIRFAPGF